MVVKLTKRLTNALATHAISYKFKSKCITLVGSFGDLNGISYCKGNNIDISNFHFEKMSMQLHQDSALLL